MIAELTVQIVYNVSDLIGCVNFVLVTLGLFILSEGVRRWVK